MDSFDKLPLASVVNGKFFVLHGGLINIYINFNLIIFKVYRLIFKLWKIYKKLKDFKNHQRMEYSGYYKIIFIILYYKIKLNLVI